MVTRVVGLRSWTGPALLLVGGCGALASTFLRWRTGLEGVYFNRSIGMPAYAGVFGSFGRNAWDVFTGLSAALAAFAAVTVLVAIAIPRVPVARINLVALVTSVIGVGIGAWIVGVAFGRAGLVGLGPGPVIALSSVIVTVVAVWLGVARGTDRVRAPLATVLAIVGGAASFASTFLHWDAGLPGGYFSQSYSRGSEAGVVSIWGFPRNAWATYAGLDIALAAFAVLAVAVALAAWRSPGRVPPILNTLCVLVGVGVGAWTLERVLNAGPAKGIAPGAVIGFAAVVMATLGLVLSDLSTRRRAVEM